MLSEEEAFVREVRANPFDDAPRLILADYLEEAGNPLAELIRTQVELSHLEPSDPSRIPLRDRERELLDAHAEQWLQPLRELRVEGVSERCFNRGLIERVRIRASDWLDNSERICRISPALHTLDLIAVNDSINELVDSEMPAQITALDLSANELGVFLAYGAVNSLVALCSAEWLPQIRELDLQFNQIADQALIDLMDVEGLRLRELRLGANEIGPSGAGAIAASEASARLEILALGINEIGEEGAGRLARHSQLDNLLELDLSSNMLRHTGAQALAQSEGFGSLRRLILRGNEIGTDGMTALARALSFGALEYLDMRGNRGETDELRQRFGDALLE